MTGHQYLTDEGKELQRKECLRIIISNRRVKSRMRVRARRTCPPGISIRPSSIRSGGDGAWADNDFSMFSVFGPYEGEYIDELNRRRFCPSYEDGYSWGIYKNGMLSHYIDGDDVKTSSWLRYVKCTRIAEKQNVTAYQYQGKIHFRAIKNIASGSEIVFWYEKKYAELLGVSTWESKRKGLGRHFTTN
ncbi:histone-lysine N-methyltransferase PRDM7-like [Clavelina lepadiformis]|uniref:histone-lysine N-methyltransferase PRDM7-like n=1 Tax=Clavelina lepadiformis TaxID=159417 RepID=UPI00404318FC